jgi:hypothetical protein
MELLERYLQAVKFWLPKPEKDDVVAELAEDLRSQVREEEAKLGRTLTDAEVELILRRCGNPLLVAERYLPQQSLIGPALFPLYRFVLKVVALVYVAPWLLVWVGAVIFMPSYRAAHPGVALFGTLWGLVEGMLYVIFGITAGFAVLERAKDKAGIFENWNPRKLPAVWDALRIRRSDTVFELAAVIVCGGWLVALLGSGRDSFEIFGIQISLNPAWWAFAWTVLIVLLVGAATSGVNLFRPYWTPGRATVRLVCDAAGAVTFALLLKAHILAGIVAPNVTPERAAWATGQLNDYLANGVPFVLIIAAITAVVDLRRVIRASTGEASSRSRLATLT